MKSPTSYKQRVDFNEEIIPSTKLHLEKAQQFDETVSDSNFNELVDTEMAATARVTENTLSQVLTPRRSLWSTVAKVGLGVLGLSLGYQAVDQLIDAWQSHQWGTVGLAAASSLFVVAGAGSLVNEVLRIRKLRQQSQLREQATELLQSHGVGQGRAFCEQLLKQSQLDEQHPAVQQWKAALHDSMNDREVVMLYARYIQPVSDKQARALISRYAADSAIMVAVSPLALLDMALVAWRSVRLVNQIAKTYGVEPGYLGRVRLLKHVLFNIAFAGTSELVRELGMDWLSQDLAARLSARAAQGIGVGLLTARLGTKAMELCRPLPWLDDKPRLGVFRQELVQLIKNKLNRRQE